MEGWVDLVDLIVPGPGVEPAIFRSRVRRRTAAPARHVCLYGWHVSEWGCWSWDGATSRGVCLCWYGRSAMYDNKADCEYVLPLKFLFEIFCLGPRVNSIICSLCVQITITKYWCFLPYDYCQEHRNMSTAISHPIYCCCYCCWLHLTYLRPYRRLSHMMAMDQTIQGADSQTILWKAIFGLDWQFC